MPRSLFHDDIVTSNRVLYTPSVFAKQNLLHIQEIGSLKAQRPHKSSRSDLHSYLFFMVLSGSGYLTYHSQRHALHKGDIVFLDCSEPYTHETTDDLWQLEWIHFSGPTAGGIYQKYLERGGLPFFTSENLPLYLDTWESLYQIASSEDFVRDMKINQGLSALLTLLMEDSWHPEGVHSSIRRDQLQALKQYLDEHYAEKITLDELSEKLYVNKFYLSRIFKEHMGVPISSYLQQLRITKAKQLLRFTTKSIEEIGYETGIGPLHYFSRVFKNVEGLSPSAFRKQWRN